MVATLLVGCRLATVVYILLVDHSATAFRFTSSKVRDDSTEDLRQRGHNVDLAARIRPLPDDQRGIYTQALQLLSSMQASPSCNRLAASTLLDSCHSIDGSRQDAETSFEDVKSIYAAQLAMCEIVSAESAIPQPCGALAPALDSKRHKAVSVKNVRKIQLSQCLQALESRPQWWTSYSNSRQNAVVMCQAARADIEKDELVKLHKSMIETNADANSALARATDQANTALMQLQDEFALAKQDFQNQLLQDLDISTAKAQSFIERLMKSMDTAVRLSMGKVTSATEDIEANTARLSQNVHTAYADTIDLQKNVGKIFQQVVEGGAELAAIQTQHSDHAQEMAIELQGSLQNMREQEIGAMLALFHGIHNQIQSSNELVTSLHTKQNALDERLLGLDRAFAGFESRVETFHAAQTRQAEVQARLHNEMQIEMQVTRGLLDNITSSAASLHATIKTTSALLGQFSSLIGNLGSVTSWVWPVTSTFVVLFVLYQISPGFAGYVLGGIVTFTILKSHGAFELWHSIPSNAHFAHAALQANVHLLPLVIGGIVLFVVLATASFYRFTDIPKILRPRKLDISSDLPYLDMEKLDCKHRPSLL